MPAKKENLIVDPSAPDPDAEPSANQPDKHGESIHPTEGIGVPIEPPQPPNLETHVETPAESQPAPPMPAELAAPQPLPKPPAPPSLVELTEKKTIPVHECHLPLRLINDAQLLIDYVNKNEWRLDTPRRKLDVSVAPIQKGYPIFEAAMRTTRHHPLTSHWYAAALILTVMGVAIDDEPKADTKAILEGLG